MAGNDSSTRQPEAAGVSEGGTQRPREMMNDKKLPLVREEHNSEGQLDTLRRG